MPLPISSIAPISMPDLPAAAGSADRSGAFGKILSGSIDKLESLNREATDAAQKFITGENQELHNVVLATQKATLAFDLGLQVRNKVVDAYQEVMKMQI
ncbi:MAG TPA: flagellar hook-basal body complex protein FliE [Bryobacteraceae bacterium]|nr:flagellar hook-basal body complex protein FliE [Bryobacteraceae bacterium]